MTNPIAKLATIPLNLATGRLKQVLILLAEKYEHTTWRPCLDGSTTLDDWLDANLEETMTEVNKVKEWTK